MRPTVETILFSNRMKELRRQSGLTQLDVAKKIGVNKQTISQYERGVREPNLEKLKTICEFYGVSADYLLGIK